MQVALQQNQQPISKSKGLYNQALKVSYDLGFLWLYEFLHRKWCKIKRLTSINWNPSTRFHRPWTTRVKQRARRNEVCVETIQYLHFVMNSDRVLHNKNR